MITLEEAQALKPGDTLIAQNNSGVWIVAEVRNENGGPVLRIYREDGVGTMISVCVADFHFLCLPERFPVERYMTC